MSLINYLGQNKVIKRICELLKVTDVQVNGTSVVDSNGIANITGTGSDSVGCFYGTCSSSADASAKTISVSVAQNFELKIGVIVSVLFSNANTASNVTLEVNNTGAKSIYYNNAVYTGSSTTVCGNANNVCTYMYDGTYWVWLSHGADSNTTYSTMSSSELTTGTATNARSVRADYLKTGINSLIDDKINALDVTGSSSVGAGKTVSAWSETNGKVSLSFQNISITKSQVSDMTTKLSDFNNDSGFVTTDEKVKQTDLATSSTGNYRILLSSDTSNTERIANVYKNRRLLFYPSTSNLLIVGASYRTVISPNYVYVGNSSSSLNEARLYSAGGQDFWVQADADSDYGVKIGVYETSPAWAFAPMTNNKMRLGSPSLKWTVVYATNSAINTSDRNEKENITNLEEDFSKDFIMDLKPVSFKRIEGDRTHFGLIAQDVEDTLTKFNLTSMDFGGLCKDQKTEQVLIKDEEGNPHYEQKEIEGEYSYGLRYEEFISPLIKMVQMQQKEIELLKQEIEGLKK